MSIVINKPVYEFYNSSELWHTLSSYNEFYFFDIDTDIDTKIFNNLEGIQLISFSNCGNIIGTIKGVSHVNYHNCNVVNIDADEVKRLTVIYCSQLESVKFKQISDGLDTPTRYCALHISSCPDILLEADCSENIHIDATHLKESSYIKAEEIVFSDTKMYDFRNIFAEKLCVRIFYEYESQDKMYFNDSVTELSIIGVVNEVICNETLKPAIFSSVSQYTASLT